MNPRLNATIGKGREIMSGFTAGQKTIVAIAVLALVVGAVGLTRWAAQPQWAPLFTNLAGSDANAIVEQLNGEGVEYKLSDNGSTVLVPQAQVYDQRLKMSGAGLPADTSSGGYGILDKQGITATDFQQNVAYRRALEGELDNTLMAIDGVKTAVVHLAMPKKDVFSDEQDKTTASVLLALKPGQEISKEQVRSITHLVAGSVEGLDAGDVTVTDSTGKLLSSTTGVGGSSFTGDSDDQTAQYEARLTDATQKMLDAVLGTGNSVVRVNAALNFDAKDSTTKTYVKDNGALPNSQSITKETLKNSNGTSTVGGTLGQPSTGTNTTTGGTGSGDYTKESTVTNNSVGEVVERTVQSPGKVDRLSVAVVLDSKRAATYNPAQVSQLVANAVGLDTARGDTVDVKSLPFDTTTAAATAKEVAATVKAEKTAGYISMGTKAGLALLAIIVLLILMRKSKKNRPAVAATVSDLPGGMLPAAPQQVAAPLVITPQIDQAQLGLDQLATDQPEEVAAMLQSWLSERRS